MYRFRCIECDHEVDVDDFGEGEYTSTCEICGKRYIIKNEFRLATIVMDEYRKEVEA